MIFHYFETLFKNVDVVHTLACVELLSDSTKANRIELICIGQKAKWIKQIVAKSELGISQIFQHRVFSIECGYIMWYFIPFWFNLYISNGKQNL